MSHTVMKFLLQLKSLNSQGATKQRKQQVGGSRYCFNLEAHFCANFAALFPKTTCQR